MWKVGSSSIEVAAGLDGNGLAGAGNLQNQIHGEPDRRTNLDMSGSSEAKPLAETSIVYGLNGTFVKVNWPVASVVVVRSNPLTLSVSWTVALGITAPLGSVIEPCTVPALPLCADAAERGEANSNQGKKARHRAAVKRHGKISWTMLKNWGHK